MKNSRKFVRFGKLGLVKQKGFGKDTFHAPPTTRGFYAMPLNYQELFLVGGINETQSKHTGYPKEPKWEDNSDVWKEYWEKRNKRFKQLRHEFTITPHTELWHHLNVPPHEVISRHNSWVKTNYKTWSKAVNKENMKLRAQTLQHTDRGGIDSTEQKAGGYSLDHFEVFFDTKVA